MQRWLAQTAQARFPMPNAQGVEGSLEKQPTEARCAVSKGSLRGSRAEVLIGLWESAARARNHEAMRARNEGKIDEAIPLENAANAYTRCASMLIREMELSNERQPEENGRDQERPASNPK